MTSRDREQSIEWESLATPQRFQYVDWPAQFVDHVNDVTISRDENMQLRLVAAGVVKDSAELVRRRQEDNAILPGAFIPSIDISVNALGSQLELKMHLENSPSGIRASATGTSFEQNGIVHRLRRTFAHKFSPDESMQGLVPLTGPAWTTDWYINGENGLRFTQATTRRRRASFTRNRRFGDMAIDELTNGHDSWDHLVVDSDHLRFAFCKVPEESGDSLLRPIRIDFNHPSPSVDTRVAIGEILSFVVGRRMMWLGSTTFDATGWPIEEEAVNPFGSNLKDQCTHSSFPPIPLNWDGEQVEQAISTLLPKYLALREPLKLRDALWSYWIAKESTPGIDLPIFASAIEGLSRSWFASTGSKSRGLHVAAEKYRELVGDLLDALDEQLRLAGLPDEIGRTIAGANRMGGNEKMKVFYREIGLVVGKNEKAAVDARHRVAHGNPADENLEEIVKFGRSYCTLFERVFLKLLGYEGQYVDRTTLGHPARDLDQPAGGT